MEIIARINIGESNIHRYLYRLCRHDDILVWQFHGYVWSDSKYSFDLKFDDNRKLTKLWRLRFEPQDLESPVT